MKCSVILCTRNRLSEVIRFLESLLKQTKLPEQLIIVDSSDEPLSKKDSYLATSNQLKCKLELDYLISKPGLTLQRNIGINHAKGDIIFFFDDDVVLEPDYIEIMYNVYRDKPEYKGGMGTIKDFIPRSIKQSISTLIKKILLLQSDFGDGKFHASGLPKFPYGTERFIETEVIGGALLSFRREIFDEFRFDEKLTGYSFMEDVDFSRRVSYKYKLFFEPRAKLLHLHGEGGRGSMRKNRSMYMVNHRYFFYKNFYSRNKLYLLPHLWSVFGLLLWGLLAEGRILGLEPFWGYLEGVVEFKQRKKDLLSRLNENFREESN